MAWVRHGSGTFVDFEAQTAADRLNVVVVDRVVNHELIEILLASVHENSASNTILWAMPCTFHSVTFNGGIDRPHRQRGPHAGLAVGASQTIAVQVVAPIGQLAQGVRHYLHRPQLERPIDFLPRGQTFAFAGYVVRQEVELRQIGRIGRLRELVLPQIATLLCSYQVSVSFNSGWPSQ